MLKPCLKLRKLKPDDTINVGAPAELLLPGKKGKTERSLGWLPVGKYVGEEIRKALTTKEEACRCACGERVIYHHEMAKAAAKGHRWDVCHHIKLRAAKAELEETTLSDARLEIEEIEELRRLSLEMQEPEERTYTVT